MAGQVCSNGGAMKGTGGECPHRFIYLKNALLSSFAIGNMYMHRTTKCEPWVDVYDSMSLRSIPLHRDKSVGRINCFTRSNLLVDTTVLS